MFNRYWPSLSVVLVCLAVMSARAQVNDSGADQSELREIRKQLQTLSRQLRLRLDGINNRLDHMERLLDGRVGTVKPAKARNAKRVKKGTKKAATLRTSLRVCNQGCDFSDLDRAIKALKPGGTITMPPGLTGTCGVIDRPLKLVGRKDGKGRRAHLAGGICLGKASLVVRAADVTISGLEISNNRARAKYGAYIRIDPKTSDLTIDDLYCHDSENGILGGLNKGRLVITNSLFERNGANSGKAHGLYINKGDELIIKKTRILATKGRGHSLKTGARRTIVEDSVLAALEGPNSGAIDAYGGGELIVRRSVLQQGKNSDSHEFIAIAMKNRRIKSDPHATILEDNWFIYDDLVRCCRWLLNGKRFGPFTVRNNIMVGLTSVHMPEIKQKVLNENRFFKNRREAQLPLYDGTIGSLPEPGFKIP